MQLGEEFGPERRQAPDASQIREYMRASDVHEALFADAAYARGLGFGGVIVPGPMLSAFLEQFVRRQLGGWRLQRLNTTFRVPTVAGGDLILRAAVTEHHETAGGEQLVCDLVIEHIDGERAVTGTATVVRELPAPSGTPPAT
jgi:acyl dehydratase